LIGNRIVTQESICDLALYPGNPRRGDVSLIQESLATNGQYRPIVVQRSTSHVLAGNHTLQAAQLLGWTQIDVHWVDVDDATARRIVLADNRTSDAGTYDDRALLELLATLPDLAGSGYDQDELQALTDLLDDDMWTGDHTARHTDTDDQKMWPKIDLKVPPHVFDAWVKLLGTYQGEDDLAKLCAHLRATGDLVDA
jgi:hypothetical protein